MSGLPISKPMVFGAGCVVLLGLVYPWPWVRESVQTVEKTAQVRRLAGPDGCMCLALTVETIWAPKSVYGGHAEAFCAPASDERMSRWLESGTVSGRWRLTFETTGLSEPILKTPGLISIEAVPAAEVLANNGCTLVLP